MISSLHMIKKAECSKFAGCRGVYSADKGAAITSKSLKLRTCV